MAKRSFLLAAVLLLAAARAAAEEPPRSPREAEWRALNSEVFHLQGLGKLHQAQPLAEKSVALARELYPPTHAYLAIALANLAELYRAQGRFDEALALDLEALAGAEKEGRRDEQTAVLQNNLGEVFHELGRLDEAALAYQRGLEMLADLELPLRTATLLTNLGELRMSQGKVQEAEELYQEAYEIQRKAPDVDPALFAVTISDLASGYVRRGDFDAATELYHRLIHLQEKLHGGRPHPDLATAFYQLADVYKQKGRWTEAEELFSVGGGIIIAGLGYDHPKILPFLEGLGAVKLEAKDYPASRRYLEHAWRIASAQPPGPPSVSITEALASVALAENDLATAHRWAERSLALAEEALPPTHPTMVNVLSTLGAVLFRQERLHEAEAITRRLIELLESGEPSTPSSLLAITYENLIAVLRQQGRKKDAEEVERRLRAFIAKQKGFPAS